MTTCAIPESQPAAEVELSERECTRLLGGGVLGRLAVVTADGLPHVLPVKYVVDGDSVVFRTDEGITLEAATHGAVAALEVDNADRAFFAGWSVTAAGVLRVITEPDDLHRVQTLPLHAWGGNGRHWIRLRPHRISGRCVSPAAGLTGT